MAAIVLASLAGLVHPWFDPTSDGSLYILTSRALLDGDGYTVLGIPFVARPPGYAALIAPILAVGRGNFWALNLFTSLFGAAAVLGFFALHRRALGAALAAVLALVVWLEPAFQQLCNRVMSDAPGLALLFGCLLLERWVDRKPTFARQALLGCALGASAWVRTVLVLLLPAILLARWLRGARASKWRSHTFRFARSQAAFVAACVLVILPWNVHVARNQPPLPLDQFELYSYETGLFHVDASDPTSERASPSEILARVPHNAPRILAAIGSRMHDAVRGWGHLALGALLLGAASILALRRRSSEDFFLLASLAVLLVFYDFTVRTVLPVFVLALGSSVAFAHELGSARFGERRTRIALGVALAVLCALDCRPRAGWDEIETRHRHYVEVAEAIERELPPDARLASGLGWHLGAFLDRPVYSLYWAYHREPTGETLARTLEKYAIDRVVLTSFEPTDTPFFAELQRSGEGLPLGEWATAFDVR
ncbi:MAG: glycosyltransferase family 39 protein [Planctomycetes bacterium]|nr:glycosyltransferase family 39 protein [Planctomycetota bacterium]